MKKHDFGAWFLLCALLFLFAPGVSAMAEETKPLFAFAAQEEEVRPGGSFAVTCTPVRGDIGAFVLFADFDAEAIANAKAELPESVKSRHVYTSQQDGRFCARLHGEGRRCAHGAVHAGVPHGARCGV